MLGRNWRKVIGRDLLRWEKTRQMGKSRFLVVYGVFHGSLLFVGATLFEWLIWHERLGRHLIEENAFVWFIGAFIGSLWSWDQNESIYRATDANATQTGSIEPPVG